MFQSKVLEKVRIHISYSVTYEIMWKSVVMPGRPQKTIWYMCIACWIPKATITLSEYVIPIAFSLPQWLHECASMFHYILIAFGVNSKN